MKVYLASPYSWRATMLVVADRLQAIGWEVTSRWLHGHHEYGDDLSAYPRDVVMRYAREDLEDVMRSDALVLFNTSKGSNSGGRHVELGVALSRGIPVLLVGEQTNPFCWMADAVLHESYNPKTIDSIGDWLRTLG